MAERQAPYGVGPILTDAALEHLFTFHPPTTPARVDAHQAIRRFGLEFARLLIAACPYDRPDEVSQAITSIRNAVMWGNAAIALSTVIDQRATGDKPRG
jgi:hypothetical protein